jgi:hypothetical protein
VKIVIKKVDRFYSHSSILPIFLHFKRRIAKGYKLHLFPGYSANLLPINKHLHNTALLFLLLSVSAIGVNAQVKFYTVVNEQEIKTGQAFQVQYIAEGATDVQDFNIPLIKNLTTHFSFDSKSTSFQSPGLQLTEAYSKIVVLSGKKTGRYVIPGATAMINGKRMKSNSVVIKIVSRGFSSVGPAEPAETVPIDETSVLLPGENADEKIKRNLFLKAIVDKRSYFAGEAVLLTYKMYARLNNSSQILKRPSLPGLSVIEMVDSYDGRPEIEIFDGRAYYVNLIRKVQGFPLQPGTIQLDVAEISSTVHFIKRTEASNQNANDINDLLSRVDPGTGSISSPYDHPVILKSQPLSLEIKPLPVINQPEEFSGAVGQFTFSVEAAQKDIHPGDLVKIKLIIKGRGNIPLLIPPSVKWPKGVDTAEPAVKEEFNKYLYPLQGFKSFEYSFTAPDTGTYIIPATDFHYFNPLTQTYQSSRSDSIKIQVTPGSTKRTTAIEGTPIPINEDRLPRQFYWFAVVALLIIISIVYQVWRFRKPEPELTVKEIKEEPIVTKNALALAKTSLQKGNIISFYHELEKSIWKTIADSCEVLPSALNKQNVSSILASKGVDSQTIQSLKEALNECEWALYVPSHETKDAENLLARVETVIAKIDLV